MNEKVLAKSLNTLAWFIVLIVYISCVVPVNATDHQAAVVTEVETSTSFLTTEGEDWNKKKVLLSGEEQAWLEAHPNIQLGAPTSYPPLVIKNAKGSHTGMLVDLFELISQQLNINIQLYIEDSWPSVLEKAKNGTIDGLASGGRSAGRKEHLNPTDTLYSSYYYVFARTNNQLHIKSVKDLKGMRIGYKKADTPVKSLLDTYDGVTPIPYIDNAAMTKGLMNKEVDVLVAWISYDFYRRDKLQGAVDNILLATDTPLDMYIHIRKDWPELIPILNKVLSSIRENELLKIMDKWFIERPRLPVPLKTHLTKMEQAWLSKGQTVQVRVTDFPPYIISKKNGPPEGIAIDFLKIIAERTGVKFNFVSSGKTFREAMQGIKNHQGPDVIATVVRTPEREEFIFFTREFIRSPYMIFMRADTKRIIAGMDDLKGKKVALVKGGVLQDMTQKDYSEVKLVLFGSHLEAIDAVANGDAEAYIGDLTRASYQILQHGYYNIRLAAPSPFGDQVLSMGVRDDWPELASILDKGLAGISPEKQAESRNKYISLRSNQPNTAEYIKWILIVAGAASSIILLFFFWNRSLSRTVTARTAELQKSKDTLKEKSDFLDKVIESAALSTWISDEKGTVIRANPACLSFFGATEDEIIGKYNLFHDIVIERHGFMPVVQDVFEKGHPASIVMDYDFRAVDHIDVKNATHKTINSIFTPIKDVSGKVSNVIVQTIDLTDIKMMEKELMQSRKMESIGNLAGGIAHDFNNILASILGFSELSLDEVEKGSTMEDNLQEIYAGGLRAKEIVKQILAFARQSDAEVKPTRVDTIIIEALKLIRPSTPATIEIRNEIDCSSMVMGNATQIHQIIMNLCTNAAQSMQDNGGILEVSLKDYSLSEMTENIPKDLSKGKYVKLVISDTGGGIAPENIDLIFDPYFTTKKTGEGTGLGLAMVRGIIDSYGGIIMVESTPSIKTVFTIYLPVTSNRDHAITSGTDETLIGGSESILFVDDEPAITRMGSRILERLGYTVTSSTNSLDALEFFRAKPDRFALVITDMTMPHMTGDKFAMELKQIREDIRIILCTGFSNTVSAENAQKIGINAFTYKPFSKADLASTVREVLDNV
jgi:PAS domain S-box-containing protein